ncbi:hypothetical protein HGRIS_005214 [Hohenbuehelia grisea]|uniref:HSF-type DNA-binding domain-containing protein n=1 Tax=Hohenbuehelia grisea TaxID=104357 RepID=A0ABR3JEB9_9AGAR
MDNQYDYQHQHRHWNPQLIQHSQPFPSPGDHQPHNQYPFHYDHAKHQQQQQQISRTATGAGGTASALSLNLSSLSVTSPPNLSPVAPPQGQGAATSPLSYHHAHHNIASQFQFNPPSPAPPPPQENTNNGPQADTATSQNQNQNQTQTQSHYEDDGGYDRVPPGSAASNVSGVSVSGSGTSSVPGTAVASASPSRAPSSAGQPYSGRKRSFSANGLLHHHGHAMHFQQHAHHSQHTHHGLAHGGHHAHIPSGASTDTLVEEPYNDMPMDAAGAGAGGGGYQGADVDMDVAYGAGQQQQQHHQRTSSAFGLGGLGLAGSGSGITVPSINTSVTGGLGVGLGPSPTGASTGAGGIGVGSASGGGGGSGTPSGMTSVETASPVDGSSGSGADEADGGDQLDALGVGPTAGSGGGITLAGAAATAALGLLGKPMATNNFVTKLYQMINDHKSAQFIAWNELGTSFVVSNVGEFSRSILGAHFKHNNFSSFVRQLNMYGFHKINRTPRAQRTSTDAQTWEFSHHKFLRGRPDLLDEIKRKPLEPDAAIKHRVELPGEVAAQLNQMRDESRRAWELLGAEKKRSDKLVTVVARLWDIVSKGFPGSMPPFPADLLEGTDNPNIYITSPSAGSRYAPPSLSMNLGGPVHPMHHSLSSPGSSPTGTEFPTHAHTRPHHSLSRQHSFQHVSFSRGGDGTAGSPMPQSPGSLTMDLFDSGDPPGSSAGPAQAQSEPRVGAKRQRMSHDDSGLVGPGGDSVSTLSSPGGLGPSAAGGVGVGVGLGGGAGKKFSRARSDSAPLGYGLTSWQGVGRPRSGSNLSMTRGVPNIGSISRGSGTPLLSIPTLANTMEPPPR